MFEYPTPKKSSRKASSHAQSKAPIVGVQSDASAVWHTAVREMGSQWLSRGWCHVYNGQYCGEVRVWGTRCLSWCLLSCPAGFPLSFFNDSDSLILLPFCASLGGTLTPLYEKDTLLFVFWPIYLYPILGILLLEMWHFIVWGGAAWEQYLIKNNSAVFFISEYY